MEIETAPKISTHSFLIVAHRSAEMKRHEYADERACSSKHVLADALGWTSKSKSNLRRVNVWLNTYVANAYAAKSAPKSKKTPAHKTPNARPNAAGSFLDRGHRRKHDSATT